jgi:polar amino acid transport system substrate-binding protein
VDVVFTNATPARAADLDFTSPFLGVEQGYLVPPGSAVVKMADLDSAGTRIGVSQGSTSERVLGRELRAASVVPTPSIASAVEMLRNGRLEAFATNKAVLFEMSDQLPGSRVLAERWGTESFAAGIPKGRGAAMPALQRRLDDMRAEGVVARAVARAGVRGTDVGK